MSDSLLTIDVDLTAIRRAFNRIPDVIARHTHPVNLATGARIRDEGRRRLRAQQTAAATGHTASQIAVHDKGDAGVYVWVDVPADRPTNLDIWLEFGTRHQEARPFLHPAAALEQGPHARAIREAVQAAIAETGLGDGR